MAILQGILVFGLLIGFFAGINKLLDLISDINIEIVEAIKLSYSTVRLCLRQLLLKTATVNRANLINWAYQEKIL